MKKWAILVLVFLGISLVVAVPRLGMHSVWTDTGIKIVMEQGIAANMVSPEEENRSTGYPVGSTLDVFRDSKDASRYAPVTSWHVAEQLKHSDTLSVVLIAIMWGLLAVSIYLLAFEITKRTFVAVGATLLLSLSMAGIQIAWTLYNTQPLIELLIVLGLYAYIRYRNTKQLRWYVLLLSTCIVAPQVRELAIIVPLVVLATTLLEKPWNKKLLAVFSIVLLYNIFPSTIPNLFFGNLVAISVFSRGAPQLYMTGLRLGQLGLSMTAHLLLYVSPILIALVALSVALFIGKQLGKAGRMWWFSLMIICSVSLFLNSKDPVVAIGNVLLLTLVVAASFSTQRVLAVWLVTAWVPFLWLYNGADAILLAPAIPLTILMMYWIYRLFSELRWPNLRVVAVAFLILGFVSLPLNLVAVNKTFSGNYEATKEISTWLKTNVPQDSIVISTLIHGEELQDFADGWFVHYYGFSMPSFPFNVSSPAEYVELVRNSHTTRDIYIVAVLSLPDGENHWLLNQKEVTSTLEKEVVMSTNYPVSDPLRTLLSPNNRPCGGAPDLVNEIVINNINPFMQQAYAKYGIYKVVQYE